MFVEFDRGVVLITWTEKSRGEGVQRGGRWNGRGCRDVVFYTLQKIGSKMNNKACKSLPAGVCARDRHVRDAAANPQIPKMMGVKTAPSTAAEKMKACSNDAYGGMLDLTAHA